jgi:crossover junction endodeoxyribonuclease RusA
MFNVVFRPPDRRLRDDDNLVAAFKSGRDGISDALGIDDRKFVLRLEIGDPVRCGAVEVDVIALGVHGQGARCCSNARC